jgi:hypothetical protein
MRDAITDLDSIWCRVADYLHQTFDSHGLRKNYDLQKKGIKRAQKSARLPKMRDQAPG